MSNPNKLSLADISRLLANPTPNARVEIADKLTKEYKAQSFAPEQLELAEQIFRLLLKDAEVHVRHTLSENLKEVKTLPHDVALQLAKDVEMVSLPILEFSEVLRENDLMEIITGTMEVSRHMAVAKRKNISDKISSALIETGNEALVENLLKNQTARIDGASFEKIGNSFSDNEKILGALLNHNAATMEIAERVMGKLSTSLRERLDDKYKEALGKLGGVFDKSREAATIKFLGAKTTDEELTRLMNYLEENSSFATELHNKNSRLAGMIESLEISGKLTPFTALCMGSMSLFEITLARLAKISIYNAKKLTADESGRGLKALYEKAGLPVSMYNAVQLVINVIKGIDKEKAEVKKRLKTPEHLASYMLEKIMTLAEGHEIDNLNYFLGMINLHAKKEGNRG